MEQHEDIQDLQEIREENANLVWKYCPGCDEEIQMLEPENWCVICGEDVAEIE